MSHGMNRILTLHVTIFLGEVSVLFQVEDFNDCPPVFVNHPTSVMVTENNNANSVIQTFAVQDCDSGINGVNGTLFSIISGTIYMIITCSSPVHTLSL